MLIQPIIENAFVHAFDSRSVNPRIDIEFILTADYLQCTVKDNGNGFVPKTNPLQKSKGLQLVIDRIQLIDKDLINPLRFSPNHPKGTIVQIQIPIVR